MFENVPLLSHVKGLVVYSPLTACYMYRFVEVTRITLERSEMTFP